MVHSEELFKGFSPEEVIVAGQRRLLTEDVSHVEAALVSPLDKQPTICQINNTSSGDIGPLYNNPPPHFFLPTTHDFSGFGLNNRVIIKSCLLESHACPRLGCTAIGLWFQRIHYITWYFISRYWSYSSAQPSGRQSVQSHFITALNPCTKNCIWLMPFVQLHHQLMLNSSAARAAKLLPWRSLLGQYIKHRACKQETLFTNTMCSVKGGYDSCRATLKCSPKTSDSVCSVISAGDQVGAP